MRTAVISDVHGNDVALSAVLADVERSGADQLVCLGDLAQGGPQPAEVVDRIRSLALPASFVLGNSDAFLLAADSGREPVTPLQLEVRDWSNERLGPERLEVLGSFQPVLDVDVGGGATLRAFHGSPTSYDDVILPALEEDEFRRLLGTPETELMTGGHVHLQWTRRYGATRFFNPGSVGLSYDHVQPDDDFRFDHFGAYALVDSVEGRSELSFRRVAFEAATVLAALQESGVPSREQDARRWAGR